jgi:hypothetical protein
MATKRGGYRHKLSVWHLQQGIYTFDENRRSLLNIEKPATSLL